MLIVQDLVRYAIKIPVEEFIKNDESLEAIYGY